MAKIAMKQDVSETQVHHVKLSEITPSKTNPRKSFDKDGIHDLAQSMNPPTGLLQPIILRVFGKGYEIVAGERRFRAAKLLKWETIPATIRNISDEEMLEFQIMENLQREDVSPMDEALAFKTLLKKESIEWLAAKIHKSKKYIIDRLKLNDLVPVVAEAVSSGVLPLGHAVIISKLSFADQKACLAKCLGTNFKIEEGGLQYCKTPLEELRQFIAYEIMLDFDKAPFDPDDATLYPEAGACKVCPKRTCNSNLLFDDITADDKCTDAACFKQKVELNISRAKDIAKEQYGKVLSGEKSPYISNGMIKVQGIEVKYSETPTKNAVPVVITKSESWNRNALGKTIYVDAKFMEKAKVYKEEQKKEKASGGDRNSWEMRRKKEMTELIWPRLEMIASKELSIPSEVVQEFLLKELDNLTDRVSMAFAGVLGYNGFAKNAEMAIKNDDYEFDFKKEMFTRIINHYSTEQVIAIIFLLQSIDEEDDGGAEIDRENEYGFTWKELMVKLGFEAAPTPAKSKKK